MYGCRMKHTPIVYVKSMKEKYIQWINKEGYLTNSMASCFKYPRATVSPKDDIL